MSEQTEIIEDVIAQALVPRVFDTYETIAAPTNAQRQQAEQMVQVFRSVLQSNPHLLQQLGWQSIDLIGPEDRLRRGMRLYAPPV